MPKLKADFVADWIARLRAELVRVWGTEPNTLADDSIPQYFFETFGRKLNALPRIVKLADNFTCLPDCQTGWDALVAKVCRGDDLNPHLSTQHVSLFNNDGLLSEWGVHHFHLGLGPHPTNPRFVERSGPLVFAIADDNNFCAIDVFPHGHFEDTLIIESVHRNWPDMIRPFRVVGTGVPLSERQRRALRKKNVNVLIAVSDGTVYGPIGGGRSAAGIKMESVITADFWRDRIADIQRRVEDDIDKFLPPLMAQGYAGEDEIKAELRFAEGGYNVFFPDYDLLAQLNLPEDR